MRGLIHATCTCEIHCVIPDGTLNFNLEYATKTNYISANVSTLVCGRTGGKCETRVNEYRVRRFLVYLKIISEKFFRLLVSYSVSLS